MARPEEMDGFSWVQAVLRRDDDPDEILEAIGLEEGDDAADRADGDPEGGDLSRAPFAEIGMKASLDRSDEGHLPSEGICLLRTADRLLHVGGGLRSVMRRFGKHVEHRAEVRADPLLAFDKLGVRHVNVAVHMGMERAGIHHHGALESEEFVEDMSYDRISV